MNQPRALPRVEAAWRPVAAQEPLVTARCGSCGRELGRVWDTAIGALVQYFQPVPGRVVSLNVEPDDRDKVHRMLHEDFAEQSGIAKWELDRDRALLAPLPDSDGWLALLDDDDYWVPGDWVCEKHGGLPVDRRMLMDQVRRARTAGRSADVRVPMRDARR